MFGRKKEQEEEEEPKLKCPHCERVIGKEMIDDRMDGCDVAGCPHCLKVIGVAKE